MALPVITLKHLEHRGGKHIALYFDYDQALIAHTKKIEGIKWSASNKCWYLPNTSGNLQQLFESFKGVAWLDLDKLKKTANKSAPKDRGKPKLKKYKTNVSATAAKQLELMKQKLATEGFSEQSIKVYGSMLETFLGFTGKDANQVTETDVRDFQFNFWVKNNYSGSTQRQFIAALKHLMSSLPDCKLDIEELVLPKKSRILPRVLSQEEVMVVLKNARNLKHLIIMSLLYSSGLRVGELINLKVADINFDRKQIHIRRAKGKKDRYVGLSNYLVPSLLQYIENYQPDTYLINGQGSLQYTASSIRKLIKRAAMQAGINKRVNPHMLRHSYATHMLENGVDIRHIQELLGHRKPETTMIYTHVSTKQLTDISSPLDMLIEKMGKDKRNDDGQKFLLSGKINPI
jgi:site-specific recombinase XerD